MNVQQRSSISLIFHFWSCVRHTLTIEANTDYSLSVAKLQRAAQLEVLATASSSQMTQHLIARNTITDLSGDSANQLSFLMTLSTLSFLIYCPSQYEHFSQAIVVEGYLLMVILHFHHEKKIRTVRSSFVRSLLESEKTLSFSQKK